MSMIRDLIHAIRLRHKDVSAAILHDIRRPSPFSDGGLDVLATSWLYRSTFRYGGLSQKRRQWLILSCGSATDSL